MLTAAFVIFGIAVLIGVVLAAHQLRVEGATAPPLMAAALHGTLAVVGLVCLVLALRGPPRGMTTGTSSFGMIALVLFVLAACAGGLVFAKHLRKGRLPGGLIGVHAALAVGGFVILAAYVLA